MGRFNRTKVEEWFKAGSLLKTVGNLFHFATGGEQFELFSGECVLVLSAPEFFLGRERPKLCLNMHHTYYEVKILTKKGISTVLFIVNCDLGNYFAKVSEHRRKMFESRKKGIK